MTDGVKTILYPVKDPTQAKAVFSAILGTPVMDQPYYGRMERGGPGHRP